MILELDPFSSSGVSAKGLTQIAVNNSSSSSSSSSGTGDVVGPASSTDKAIALYNGTTGKLIQSQSKITIDPTTGVMISDMGTDGKIIYGSIFGVPVQLFYNDSTDAQFAMAQGGGGLQFGAGGASAADVTIIRTAANTMAMGAGDKLQQNQAPSTGDDLTNKTYVDSGTTTLTNKRITKRVVTSNAPGATPTMNTDNGDVFEFTGLAAAITSMTTNLSGTPVNGDIIEIAFVDNGTPRAIAWGTSFASSTVTLPVTTVTSTVLRVLLQYQTIATLNKWVCIAVA